MVSVSAISDNAGECAAVLDAGLSAWVWDRDTQWVPVDGGRDDSVLYCDMVRLPFSP